MAAASTDGEPAWIGSSWQEIELEEQPQPLPDYYAIQPDAPRLYQAPFSRRMMATMVDAALILSLVWGTAYLLLRGSINCRAFAYPKCAE